MPVKDVKQTTWTVSTNKTSNIFKITPSPHQPPHPKENPHKKQQKSNESKNLKKES